MYYLILDSDFSPQAATIEIIAESTGADALLAIRIYDPTTKATIATAGLTFKFLASHDVQNSLSGEVEAAAIYKT